ncbi:putative non-specific serine/threonine protein kinase [Helianthus annuus]|nr:putative non-specific serine/threonine protein kinase [Helianthus annuus]KAJ0732701.1 putative non-specific serine/threonine protein kinase [Helianthus annuus]KAJ0906360.1 putative non-specific serine/threonine protein kinase [Helianthus annuus]
MSAKWLLFSRPILFAILMHFAAFSTLIHMSEAHNGTTDDSLALLAIKSMIKDDPQGVMTSWNHSTTDFCQWQGVTCGARHKRVALLDLSSRGLTGTLSPSIGNLSFLRELSLKNNSFSGEIPPEIGHLFRLQKLRLHNNSFTGNIPATIMNCSNLQVLHLGDNKLVGKIPDGIGSLSLLNFLIVHDNILEGGIPLFIANLTLLVTLSLADCQLGGSFPDVFQRLTNLKRLALAGNNLTGTIPPSLYNCSSLEQVFLDENQLTGRLPLNLGSLMPHLVVLSLGNNHIEGIFLDIPPKLEVLDLRSNNFWGKLPSLSNDSSLIILALSNNFFVGSLHNLVCSNGVKMIGVLDLGDNNLSGDIPQCWEKWSSLYFLSLRNNNLSGEFPRTLGSVTSLQLLNMRGNKILGRIPSSLMNLSNLKILQLGRNELVGNIPTWIGTKLTFLRILNLRSNNFYGSIPLQLCYLSHAQILDLAHNNLSGNIPRCFNNFSVLAGIETSLEVQFSFSFGGGSSIVSDSLVMKGREDTYTVFLEIVKLLDLSSNNFSGEIPNELMALQELISLNLSRNQLTGNIPDKIGDMKALESFDLSLNRLSGELPMSLSKLNFISIFNVSYNKFTGRVPTSTQIQSLNESNFIGNKLCGAPLISDCKQLNVPDTLGDQKEDNRSHGSDWGLIISIVLGFIIGFWVLVASLIVNKSWRIAYFRLWGKLIDRFLILI